MVYWSILEAIRVIKCYTVTYTIQSWFTVERWTFIPRSVYSHIYYSVMIYSGKVNIYSSFSLQSHSDKHIMGLKWEYSKCCWFKKQIETVRIYPSIHACYHLDEVLDVFTDSTVDIPTLEIQVNAVATVLKAFFADLTDPLVPVQLYDELSDASGGFNRKPLIKDLLNTRTTLHSMLNLRLMLML